MNQAPRRGTNMTNQKPTVIGRVSRHPLSDAARNILESRFPEGIEIVELGDVPFGTTPRKNILDAITASGKNVELIEINAPIGVLIEIIGKLGETQLIQQIFKTDTSGRKVVVGKDENGRDLFEPVGFKVITKISIEEEQL